jgi:hypothetical protein
LGQFKSKYHARSTVIGNEKKLTLVNPTWHIGPCGGEGKTPPMVPSVAAGSLWPLVQWSVTTSLKLHLALQKIQPSVNSPLPMHWIVAGLHNPSF